MQSRKEFEKTGNYEIYKNINRSHRVCGFDGLQQSGDE